MASFVPKKLHQLNLLAFDRDERSARKEEEERGRKDEKGEERVPTRA